METTYIKLKDLVNGTFTIKKVHSYKWKKWDDEKKVMLVSDKYFHKAQKRYPVTTDKGVLELSQYQLKDLLEIVVQDGVANIIGKMFRVRSNGKQGKEIRYYFDLVRERQTAQPDAVLTPEEENAIVPETVTHTPVAQTVEDIDDMPVDLDDIPF